MTAINLNAYVKVQLTKFGAEIYNHQYDWAIGRLQNFERPYPAVDEDGYMTIELWRLFEIYGKYVGCARDQIFKGSIIYLNEAGLEKVLY
jgi:hypothetical protein